METPLAANGSGGGLSSDRHLLSITLGIRRSAQERIAEAIKIRVPPGINSLERVRLGGVDQWILVRGHDTSDEVLLFVHGGPGVPNMPLCHMNADLERRFVVVQWDQRGAGKSFSTSVPPEAMTIDQFVSAARALTQLLIERFDKDKIYLLGHSWGSVVGAKTAARYPELFLHRREPSDRCPGDRGDSL